MTIELSGCLVTIGLFAFVGIFIWGMIHGSDDKIQRLESILHEQIFKDLEEAAKKLYDNQDEIKKAYLSLVEYIATMQPEYEKSKNELSERSAEDGEIVHMYFDDEKRKNDE